MVLIVHAGKRNYVVIEDNGTDHADARTVETFELALLLAKFLCGDELSEAERALVRTVSSPAE